MLKVLKVSKKFGEFQALNEIEFEIKEGEFYGLLGPNGAGKSTTIAIISSLLEPTTGEVFIDDLNLKLNPKICKQQIGIVPQEIALYNDLSAFQNLLFWGGLYKVPNKELIPRIKELLILFGLENRQHDKIKTYSGGMKRRINIAASLLHQPKLLLMDEPTVGIDPQSRNFIYDVFEQLQQQGITILYTTHYMEEAERFCQRIGIIDQGKIIAQGSLQELKTLSKMNEIICITSNLLNADSLPYFTQNGFTCFLTENKLQFHSNHINSDIISILNHCQNLQLDIQNIEIQKVNLESIFLNLTGKQLRD